MLSKRVIKKILEIGFYFDDDFDFEKEVVVITPKSKKWFHDNLGIKKLNSAFIDFYSFCVGGCGPNSKADCLFTLEEILENAKAPFHSKYSQIGKRYLQLSSIEGEYSYFYDTETDYIYGIYWNEMDDFFVKGKLSKPLFTSFYDFLEWYYTAG
jgi:hypothetical protein